jgi:hypothetical protein
MGTYNDACSVWPPALPARPGTTPGCCLRRLGCCASGRARGSAHGVTARLCGTCRTGRMAPCMHACMLAPRWCAAAPGQRAWHASRASCYELTTCGIARMPNAGHNPTMNLQGSTAAGPSR